MDKWHVGKKIVLTKLKGPHKDDDRIWCSEYYHGTKRGYGSNDLKITLHRNGAMNFSEVNGDGFVYLYPEQVEHLEKILRQRRKPCEKKTRKFTK